MSVPIRGVHHIGMSVPDIDVARRFYVELLGAEEISATEWEPGNDWIDSVVALKGSAARTFIARLKNVQIECFEYLSPRSPEVEEARPVNLFGYTHIGFEVDDVQATYERMVEAGLTFHAPPDLTMITTDEDGRKAGFSATYGRDFFGNVFEIMEIHDNELIKPN